MSKINTGVVVVTKFVDSTNSKFKSYIDYIDRDNATRNEYQNKYNEYMDYMDNPEKTSELFTSNKDNLSTEEKQALKDTFKMAQENKSMMWQTVISFDNDWLAQNGLYDKETHLLNEEKLKECTRGCMRNMLSKELLNDTAIWSAAIHYNTDNIHIHIATVEPIPTREKIKRHYATVDKNWLEKNNISPPPFKANSFERAFGKKTSNETREYYEKINEVLEKKGINLRLGNYIGCDKDGNLLLSMRTYGKLPKGFTVESKEEIKAKFKESSIESGKSFVINNIISSQHEMTKINDIIRNDIIANKKENPLIKDRDLCKAFLDIYSQLPEDKRMWQYNMNALKDVRPQIDTLTNQYIQKYHAKEFNELTQMLESQGNKYQTAYGKGYERDYTQTKLQDLYARMGNTILKEMKAYDYEIKNKQYHKQTSYSSNGYINPYLIENSMRKIKKYLSNDFTTQRNQYYYEKLERDIENER